MRKDAIAAIVVCGIMGLAPPPLRAAPRSWELRDGRWQQVASQTPDTQPVHEPAFDEIDQHLTRGENSTACKKAVEWLKKHGDSPLRDRGLMLMARALYQYGDRIKSFYYLDELMDTYPESALFYDALEMQYRIADNFLKGYKLRFLYMPLFTAEGEGVEMLFRIQQRAPGSPLAEKALRRTADYYYADSQFDLAADAYAAYARAYPRSPEIPIVRLRQAFSALAQFRGIRFDATPLLDARAQLIDVATAYPDLASQENLLSVVERIDATFARKIYDRADYYARINHPKAAAYNFTFLVKTYPGSPEAQLAQSRLDRLPASAKQGVQPIATGSYAPATQPMAGGQ